MRHSTLIRTRARALRSNMTGPEVMLWSRLRGRGEGRPTFRRQHPIEMIIVDFYCPAARLAVEVDGSTHWEEEKRARDAARDHWLEKRGVVVMRIQAAAIYRDLAAVMNAIQIKAAELIRISPARGLLPPPPALRPAVPLPPMLPHRGR